MLLETCVKAQIASQDSRRYLAEKNLWHICKRLPNHRVRPDSNSSFFFQLTKNEKEGDATTRKLRNAPVLRPQQARQQHPAEALQARLARNPSLLLHPPPTIAQRRQMRRPGHSADRLSAPSKLRKPTLDKRSRQEVSFMATSHSPLFSSF